MGQIVPASPVLLLITASSRYEAALAWTRQKVEAASGNVVLASPMYDFTETDYYEATMGTDLKKQFLALQRPVDPGTLADVKIQTNAWEAEFNAQSDHAEPRPLNLDPGYLSLGKLVLASTKDHAHRLYLRDGIYAEVTLYYSDRRWQAHTWTYPDFQRGDYQAFFTRCRDYLKEQIKAQRQQERLA